MAKKKRRAPVNKMTTDFCKKNGWLVDRTERWVPYQKITKDLFGFIDFVALRPDVQGVLAIQTTTFSNRLARVEKIRDACKEEAEQWLRCGNQIQVWGWRRPTKTLRTWKLAVVDVQLSGTKLVSIDRWKA